MLECVVSLRRPGRAARLSLGNPASSLLDTNKLGSAHLLGIPRTAGKRNLGNNDCAHATTRWPFRYIHFC
jgi:hypothetical protein